MTILEMSISAGLFILAVTVFRALALHKLPHKGFLFLWGVALFLLFAPVRIPSPVSFFALLRGPAAAAAPVSLPVLTGQGGTSGGFAPVAPAAPPAPLAPAMGDVVQPGFWQQVSPFTLLWLGGCLLCAGFFLATHLRCRARYTTALPCTDPRVSAWLAAHKLRRPVQARVSDQITAPLTYGILRPVILLPKGMERLDGQGLDYVLTHEWTHIRRFDVAFKTLLVAGICLHWFNPLVWVMFVLAGRDIELSCDEAVVRLTGQDRRRDYAMALICLEEQKSRFAPLCTSFSKNGVEERIKGIMKWKKSSVVSVVLALLLVVGTVTVFATSATRRQDPDPRPDVTPARYDFLGEDGNHSAYTEEDYAALMALKTEGYREESLTDFSTRLRQVSHVYSGYSPSGENGETPQDSVTTATNHNVGTDQYYGAQLDYIVQWQVREPDSFTVGRRDDILNTAHAKVQGILDSTGWDTLNSPDVMALMQKDCDELAESLCDDDITITILVEGVNSASDDTTFAAEEYAKLLELRPEGWGSMTIEQFRAAVFERLAQDEDAYRLELDRASRDNSLGRIRYSNADASFILNVLAPLTADGWEMWDFGLVAYNEGGTAEAKLRLTVLDGATLTVDEYTGCLLGMATALDAAVQNAPPSLWQDMTGMGSLLQNAAAAILEAENRALKAEVLYMLYAPADRGSAGVPAAETDASIEEMYRMLLDLAVPGYQDMSVKAFRAGLLNAYSENGSELHLKATIAVMQDLQYEETVVPLTAAQRYFLSDTLRSSEAENNASVNSLSLGAPQDPVSHPYVSRTSATGDELFRANYELQWHIPDPEQLSVAERDAALSGVTDGVRNYVDARTEEELVGIEDALLAEAQRLAEVYSTPLITLRVRKVQILE